MAWSTLNEQPQSLICIPLLMLAFAVGVCRFCKHRLQEGVVANPLYAIGLKAGRLSAHTARYTPAARLQNQAVVCSHSKAQPG